MVEAAKKSPFEFIISPTLARGAPILLWGPDSSSPCVSIRETRKRNELCVCVCVCSIGCAANREERPLFCIGRANTQEMKRDFVACAFVAAFVCLFVCLEN